MAALAAFVLPTEGEAPADISASSPTERADCTPRYVIRGENPSDDNQPPEKHSQQPRIETAFVDWLNFSFHYGIHSDSKFINLDRLLQKAFGFGITQDRHRKHLNYEQSWVLGDDFGILASGGNSVGGTTFITLSGTGCSVVASWTEVYYLLETLKAKITRIDLAHDEFSGPHDVLLAKRWLEEGKFNAPQGRPPSGQFIDDLGSNKGKTLYVGSRKNGKLLRIYEKGKQLGDPTSHWNRWECELHNINRNLAHVLVIAPGTHLAGTYPCMDWIYQRQTRIETTRQTLAIGLDVLLDACRNSYGKFFWALWKGLEWTPEQILATLATEGLPKRLSLPVGPDDEA